MVKLIKKVGVNINLEIISTTLSEAIDAEKAGADRIELISGILEGGLTPSISLIKEVTKKVKIPVNIMIRIHSKSFTYNEHDMLVMLKDIKEITKTNAEGIVFGALNKNNTIDEEFLKQVIEHKKHLKLTFHRAFDETNDQEKALDTLLKYDVNTILTSGGEKSAYNAIDKINKLVSSSKNKIIILAGAGLSLDNISDFTKKTKINEVHFGSGVRFNNVLTNEIDKNTIKKIKSIIK